jgi:hypothetical protein
MLQSFRRFTLLGLAALVVTAALAASPAQAQFRPVRNSVYNYNLANPNYFVAPGLTLNQAAYNIRVLGGAYQSVPPYALGYNPYVRSVNYGPVYSPYSMPYSSGYGGYGGYSGYNPYWTPYYNPYNYYYPYSYGYGTSPYFPY